jgi:hypothetical protein
MNALAMPMVKRINWADHLPVDTDKAAWLTIERALERAPLARRRRALRLLRLYSARQFDLLDGRAPFAAAATSASCRASSCAV